MIYKKQKSVLFASITFLRVLFYALFLLWVIYWRFGKLEQTQREERLRQAAKKMLVILGVSVHQSGDEILAKNCLRASNHVSWLDILVVYACSPCRFIAKAEVKKFPIIGRIACNAGTLFLDRSSIKDAIRISEQVAQALKDGSCIAFFPEATTSEGEGLLPLHPSLFESALQAQSYVQAITLRFHTRTSMRAAKYAAYVRLSLVRTLWQILRHGGVQAAIISNKPFQPVSTDTRHTICAKVEEQMACALNHLNYNSGDLPSPQQESAKVFLQFSYINDALLWLLDAQKKGRILAQHYTPQTLLELRQLIYLLQGGAHYVGFERYGEAAKIFEICLNRWIKTKELITEKHNQFIHQTLQDLRQWQRELPQNDIPKEQVVQLWEEAKALMYPYKIDSWR